MRPLLLVVSLGCAAPAFAQDLRDFCPDRPGLGTPSCTLDAGRVAVEIGAIDWTLERDPQTRTDTILAGDMLVRFGLADHAEFQIGWTPYGHVRQRDRASGAVSRSSGAGDVTVALRRNLRNPDGAGFSIAIMPYATLPTGGSTIGAGDWGAGMIAPVSVALGGPWSLALSPEIDAAVDGDRNGRHLAYGSVIGLGVDLSATTSASLETAFTRDNDPDGHTSQSIAGLSIAWTPQQSAQFDMGANMGLTKASPDLKIYFGIARRF